jgi:LuxR family maltose regulon positive regulatory protein
MESTATRWSWADSIANALARAETALGIGATLTTAELRVLRCLPTHYSFHEIAQRLHVSANTVKTRVHAAYRKLDASSRSEAVAHATDAGLLGC